VKSWISVIVLMTAVLLMAAQCGGGASSAEAQIIITEPYARAGIPNGAVFMELKNEGGVDDALIRAQTDVAETVELHESKMDENGMMKMSPVPNIPVSAGGATTLKPGGLHVMLIGMQEELAVGDEFSLTLDFEKTGAKTIQVEVRESMMTNMSHGDGEMNMENK
jgi:copper(I)-binding protein